MKMIDKMKDMIKVWKEYDCLSHPEKCIKDCCYREKCKAVSDEVFQ